MPAMIRVAAATDRAYWPYLPALLRGIERHVSRPVVAHILVRDIPEAPQWARGRSNDATRIEVYDSAGFLDGTKLYLSLHMPSSRATMDRLLLPDLLPQVDRLIYLDIDVLVQADLAELYDRNAGPIGIIARPSENPRFTTIGRSLVAWRHDNIDHILPYIDPDWSSFNAGVMLLDLAQLRAEGFGERTLRLVHEWGVNDQIACAIYAEGKFSRLDPSWNVIVGYDHQRVSPWRILHWAGAKKPWHVDAPLHCRWRENTLIQQDEKPCSA